MASKALLDKFIKQIDEDIATLKVLRNRYKWHSMEPHEQQSAYWKSFSVFLKQLGSMSKIAALYSAQFKMGHAPKRAARKSK